MAKVENLEGQNVENLVTGAKYCIAVAVLCVLLYFSCVYCCSCLVCIVVSCLVCIVVVVLCVLLSSYVY